MNTLHKKETEVVIFDPSHEELENVIIAALKRANGKRRSRTLDVSFSDIETPVEQYHGGSVGSSYGYPAYATRLGVAEATLDGKKVIFVRCDEAPCNGSQTPIFGKRYMQCDAEDLVRQGMLRILSEFARLHDIRIDDPGSDYDTLRRLYRLADIRRNDNKMVIDILDFLGVNDSSNLLETA